MQFAQLSRAYSREAVKTLPKLDNNWVGKPVTLLFAVTVVNGVAQDAAALELNQEAP